jgi:hypothetical protein
MLLYRLDKRPVLDSQPDCLFPVCHLIRSLLLELRLAIPIRLTTMCLFVSLLPTGVGRIRGYEVPVESRTSAAHAQLRWIG